jgi:probable rRNA maturation factor
MIIEINNTTRSKINLSLIRQVTEKFLVKYKLQKKEISIAFIGDKKMTALNAEYRKIKKPTDILSFSGEGNDLGELIIDINQIKRQAKQLALPEKKELVFILVHGLLHLIGHDDDTEDKRLKMIKQGEEIIENFKLKI